MADEIATIDLVAETAMDGIGADAEVLQWVNSGGASDLLEALNQIHSGDDDDDVVAVTGKKTVTEAASQKRKQPPSKATTSTSGGKKARVAAVAGRKTISVTDKPASRKEATATRRGLMEVRDLVWGELIDNPRSSGLMVIYDRLERMAVGEKEYCFLSAYQRAKLKLDGLLNSDAQRHSHSKARKAVEKAETHLLSVTRACILKLEKNE